MVCNNIGHFVSLISVEILESEPVSLAMTASTWRILKAWFAFVAFVVLSGVLLEFVLPYITPP